TQPAFQKGPCIDTGCAMRLQEHKIAAKAAGFKLPGAEKMVEADFKKFSRAGIAGNVAAKLTVGRIRPQHHGQCVPANYGAEALLQRKVSRIRRLAVGSNSIDIGRAKK